MAVGYQALYSNQPSWATNGVSNTAVGDLAMLANTTGFDNSALGEAAARQSR